jgi:hypothetical protein
MSMHQKLETLAQRRAEVTRELEGLAASGSESANSAIVDLEKALLVELSRIEDQIKQVQSYLANCEPV